MKERLGAGDDVMADLAECWRAAGGAQGAQAVTGGGALSAPAGVDGGGLLLVRCFRALQSRASFCSDVAVSDSNTYPRSVRDGLKTGPGGLVFFASEGHAGCIGNRLWRVPDLVVQGHVTLHRPTGPDQIGALVGFEVSVRVVVGGG